MKSKIILALLLCQAVSLAYSQRYVPAQKGIQITGNYADGTFIGSKNGSAYSIGLAYSRYTKKANRFLLGTEYFHKPYIYKDIHIPVNQVNIETGYYFKILSSRKKVFFLSAGLLVFTGYETLNWGKKNLYDGSTLQNSDNFIGGGSLGLELETFLHDNVILLIGVKERACFGSSVGKFHSLYGIGLKFLIN